MAAAIGFGDAIQIVELAMKLYSKIKNQSKEIDDVAKIMEDLESHLKFLEALIKSKQHMQAQLGPLWNLLTKRLVRRIQDIRRDAQDVYDIMDVFHRYGKIARALFPLGRNPKELRILMEDLKQHRKALRADL